MKPQSRPLAGIALATALVAAAAQAPAAGPGPLDLLAPPKSAAPDGVGAGVPKPPRKPADAATVGSIKPLTAAE
ncbi:MAG: hypothetical protein KGQ28_09020, partial [Hyphomicrobiales bacterium]|nr:hypothetical protein [Hyphomicrobiales bacterium]